MSETATTKTWRNRDWLWTVYVFSPWFAYPFLVILRESILGYRRFSFGWVDWLGGHARTSVFELNNIALALAFILYVLRGVCSSLGQGKVEGCPRSYHFCCRCDDLFRDSISRRPFQSRRWRRLQQS